MSDAMIPEFGTPEWRRYWMRQPVNVIVTALQIAGQGLAREISSAVATEAEVARLRGQVEVLEWFIECYESETHFCALAKNHMVTHDGFCEYSNIRDAARRAVAGERKTQIQCPACGGK